ncbi:General negative regulator of transcription subunit 3 [Candida viswanathii]|uniref:General negative regulator of transcription subunit 3 n=1 Tax=Candida viswanathii TaxID=5486 RepID=A0A367YMU8_9ASCO|nr:General negative regulator of transcription subunit 3 [Candida viswanathii]
MSNRKLQKEIDIIFKKIQEGLQDFNYHYERYESIQNTEDDSDNQREKEKLANDLKKEIKKLQKFREQIKHWLQNDTVNTLGPVGTSYSGKLSENKSLIEEAMETYKSVEKQSKLKTFSNQSIMMTFMDSNHGDDDDDDDSDDDDLFSGSEEEEDEFSDLPEDAVNSIRFLKDSILQLTELTAKLDHEYEKLAAKKLRKNNLATIEAKKEKIQLTISNNKFHQKKIKKLLKQLKNGMVTEFNLIWMLKEDLEKYLSANGDYAFTKETDLYDDIFNQIAAVDEDYSEIHDDSQVLGADHHEQPASNGTAPTSTSSQATPSPRIAKANGHVKESSTESPAKPHSLPAVNTDVSNHSTVQQQPHHHLNNHNQQQQQQQHTQQQEQERQFVSTQGLPRQSPEMTSPAIVRTLKPASTPSKPVGNLKWSAAAAAAIPEVHEKARSVEPESNGLHQVKSNSVESQLFQEEAKQAQKSQFVTPAPLQVGNINLDQYKEVIKNSSLSKTELGLFLDMNLVRVPPGIQDLVISFASKRYNDEFKVLVDSNEFNQFTLPLHKSYLPEIVQPNYYSQFTNFNFKHPSQLTKFQSYWNQIRANFGFEKLVEEIKTLTAQNLPENVPSIAELTFVLFYGFYYGVTPAENLIAESYLHELGWKPYRTQLEGNHNNSANSPLSAPSGVQDKCKSSYYFYWFKRVKLISRGEEMGQPANIEFGDYQVFDLSFWEIFVKYGYKFDYNLCQLEPSKSLF